MINKYKYIFTELDLISAASLTLICVIESLRVFLSHIFDPVALVSIGRLPFNSTNQRVKTTRSLKMEPQLTRWPPATELSGLILKPL